MSTFRVLVTDELSPQAMECLDAAADVSYDVVKRPAKDKLIEIIPQYDALLVRSSGRIDADVLAAATRLKVVGRAGAGVDNIDVEAASLRGVMVMNTPGANTIATAEHTMTLMLALCRHIPQADASLRAGQWERSRFLGVQLYQKVLGIVGLGRVGQQVARRAQGFEMSVIAFDPHISDEVAHELKVELVGLDDLLTRSDFISLNAALTAESRGLIGAANIARMKPGVRIINCARGALLDENALYDALVAGHVAGAALDVFGEEPLSADSKLRTLANVVLTPHLAASTIEAQRDVGTKIVDQVLAALRGESYHNAVNVPVADPSVFRQLKPYLALAERLGSLQMQLADGPLKRVELELHGDDIADHSRPLTVALLKGLLDPITDAPVNYINAPLLARQRGITVSQTSGLARANYANLLSCRVAWDGGEHMIAGSLLGHELPRVVQVDDFVIDAQPEGTILVLESVDVPGVIGRVGTLLGGHNINIAEWRLGRIAPGHQVLSFINLDGEATPEVLTELAGLAGVVRVRQVTL
jgi:D-3-phosphoglycerate dehydrogenase